MARVFVLTELGAHEVLHLLHEGVAALPAAHEKRLDDLAAQLVGHADHGGLLHIGVHEQHVLDLDGAHGPARRDDHVVGATTVVEVAVLVGAAQVLGGNPFALALHHELAGLARWADAAFGVMHFDPRARHGLAERAALDRKVQRAWIAHQHHADLGRAIHAADFEAEDLLHIVGRVVVDGLAGERELVERVEIVARLAAVLHHAVVRGGGRHVGEAVLGQRLEQSLRIEAPAVRTHRQPKRERCQRAVPQAMSPGGRRWAEEAIARTQPRAVERRHHQRDHGAMRVAHGFGQLACRARCVLEHGQIVGA